MTEPQIIQTLKDRPELPPIPIIISEFHVGYQMAVRIRAALPNGIASKSRAIGRAIVGSVPAMEIDLFEL